MVVSAQCNFVHVTMKSKKALMIVHQPRSSTGDVGMKLRERGYELDVRRPVIGEKLPESMDEHDVAVIYGGPPSANDNLDYIKYEIDWISTALLSNKPFTISLDRSDENLQSLENEITRKFALAFFNTLLKFLTLLLAGA